MRKLVLTFAFCIIAISSLMAFDLVVPSSGEEVYSLFNSDNDEFIVDDSVYFKSALDGEVKVERYSDHITSIEYGHGDYIVVLLNATRDELDEQRFSLSFSVDDPDVLIVNSPVDYDFLDEIDADDVYISGRISGEERAMLRRLDVDFTELDPSSILRFEGNDVSVISGSKYPSSGKDGIYVTCPKCGTTIYVPLN